ncbi:hypothetical protein D9M68_602230 [compost metagenome]
MFGEVAEARGGAGPEPEGVGARDDQEDDDGCDLDAGEPVFGFPEGVHRHQVQQRHTHHQPEGDDPHRQVREPAIDDLAADHGLEADDNHPEVPVQPAGHVAGWATEGHAGVIDEGTLGRMRGGHFAEHAHHQRNDQAGDGIGDESARPGRGDHRAGTHEQPRANNAAQGQHADVSSLECTLQARVVLCLNRHL